MTISELVEHIVGLPRRERIRACKRINATADYFEDRQITGIVTTEELLSLLRSSYTSPSVAGFLASVLYFVDSDVLTEEVFQKLCRFPNKRLRRTFLVALSHCRISVYQLEAICKLQICSEAYAQLLWHAATNDCFTLTDVRKIVAENRRFERCVDYLSLARNEAVSEAKRRFFHELSSVTPQ